MVGRWIRLLTILARGFSGHTVGCFLLCAGLAAQDLQKTSVPLPEAPVPASISVGDPVVTQHRSSAPPEGPRRITLEEAQAQAQTVDRPMAHLAQLQVEAARQARLASQSEYFPKVSSTFLNLHFNKFTGDELVVFHLKMDAKSQA